MSLEDVLRMPHDPYLQHMYYHSVARVPDCPFCQRNNYIELARAARLVRAQPHLREVLDAMIDQWEDFIQ